MQNKTRRIVHTAIIFALAIVLSVVEGMLPPPPIPIPNFKYGLSNIAVLYALIFISKKSALAIAFMKSIFMLLTRGAIASILTFCGGILSIVVMILLLLINKEMSVTLLSVFGAIAHNIGQIGAVVLLYQQVELLFYLPWVLIIGIIAGILTAVLFKVITPALKKLA